MDVYVYDVFDSDWLLLEVICFDNAIEIGSSVFCTHLQLLNYSQDVSCVTAIKDVVDEHSNAN